MVLLPAFVSPQDQRRLVRWSLRDHARHPNETNLDAHYLLPPEGVWNAHLQSRTAGTESPLIRTRVSLDREPSSSGPRQLIANDPASVTNFSSLQSLPKLPPEPSTTVSDCIASDLVSKLRWANIGWSYHWGSKQYNFSKGKGEIDPFLRDLCRCAVSVVPWKEVFDEDDLNGWGEDDWRTWKETYGSYRNHSHNETNSSLRTRRWHCQLLSDKGRHVRIVAWVLINARVIAGYAHGSRRPLRGLRNFPTRIDFVSCDRHTIISPLRLYAPTG